MGVVYSVDILQADTQAVVSRSARAKVNRAVLPMVAAIVATSLVAQRSVGGLPPTLRLTVIKNGAGVVIFSNHCHGRSAHPTAIGFGCRHPIRSKLQHRAPPRQF